MSRILIYVFPCLMDMVVGSTVFACSVRAAENGRSPAQVANIITVFSLAYMLACPIVGRLVKPRNAAAIIIGVCVAVAGVACAFIFQQGYATTCVLVAATAFIMGFFFVAFQVFMKAVDCGAAKGVAYSTGLYTFSWSTGLAFGPLISSFLWTSFGWEYCYGFVLVASLATGIGVCLLKHHAHAAAPKPHAKPAAPALLEPVDYSRMPDLAWMGWLCGGIGALTFAMMRGVFPSSGSFFHLSRIEQGTVFFIGCGMQALTGLAMMRSRTWMYRPLPLAAFGALGAAGLALFALASRAPMFCLAAACYGVYSGAFFFYLVFHALVHPVKSARYVSFNESVVGATGIAGPLIGGILADRAGLPVPYALGAGLVLLAVATQVVVHGRHASRVRRPQGGVRPVGTMV